jgi:hypothetical protein
MQRGLDGRRIAVYAIGPDDDIRRALEEQGAVVSNLAAAPRAGAEEWHGAKYAGLVIACAPRDAADEPRLVQLVREFLVSDKPVAIFGEGEAVLQSAGGSAEDVLVWEKGGDVRPFAIQVAGRFSKELEDRQLDDMSEQSFPASDPPSTTPASVGHVAPDSDHDART